MSQYISKKSDKIFEIILEKIGDNKHIKFKNQFFDLNVEKDKDIVLNDEIYKTYKIYFNDSVKVSNKDMSMSMSMTLAYRKDNEYVTSLDDIKPLKYDDYHSTRKIENSISALKETDNFEDNFDNIVSKEIGKFVDSQFESLNASFDFFNEDFVVEIVKPNTQIDNEGNVIDNKFKQVIFDSLGGELIGQNADDTARIVKDYKRGLFEEVAPQGAEPYYQIYTLGEHKKNVVWHRSDRFNYGDEKLENLIKSYGIDIKNGAYNDKVKQYEELAIYRIRAGHGEYSPTIALSEKEADSYVETYYDTLGITRDDYKKVTDLIEIKKSLYYENEAQGIFNYSDEYKDFAKKVDEKLIEYICDKYYSGYENCEADQKFFKENNVFYTNYGEGYEDYEFIDKIRPIGSDTYFSIMDFYNLGNLDQYFEKKLDKSEVESNTNFELPVIEKISMSEAVKKTAKTGEYPDFYNDFVEDSKRVYNFGVFAVQNGVTPTQTARFLQQITLVGETNKFKEKIIPAIDRFIAENENGADKFKKNYGVSPDTAKKLFEYEHIDEILKFNYTKQSTFMKSWGEEMQLKLDEKLLGAFLSYWQQNPLTAENIKDFSDTYFHLEAVAMTFGKFDELEKLWQDKYPLWASKEAEEIFRIPKNKDGLTMREDWEQNWKDKILYPKASHFIEVMKKETYTKNLWTDEEIIEDQAKTTKRDLEQTREIANSKFKEWRRELEDFYGIEVSDTNHNENYAEWYHDGLGAIKKLLAEQQGRVVGAFHREDIGDIDIRYKELSKFKIEPEKLADIIQNGKITLKNVENQGYTAVTTIKKDDFVLVLKQYEVGFSKRNFEFDSFIQINKQENTMPSADYTKRQNETNGGAYSRTKNNYNANYGNYGKRQNHAHQEQGEFNQTNQNTATQTATAPQKAEQNDYKSRQQYASKSYKSPKTQNTEQPKTEKPKSFELAKQDKLEVDEAIKSLQKALKDPKTKEKAQIALMSYLSQFNDLHNYTARNIALAQKQAKERGMDNVSHLASFDTWKKMKGTEKDENGEFKSVSVLKGEKGLSILVPQFKPRFLEQRDIDKNAKNPFALVLDENGQKQPVMTKTKNEKGEIVEVQKQELAYFTQGKVFDISQTNAFEIGAIKKLEKAKVGEFDGQITDFTLQTIASKITEKYGFEVNFAPLNRGARGYCSEKDGKIEIFIDNRHLSEASQLATLFHELGHAVLNHTSKSKEDSNTKEVQAETFAFVLSNKFGLETTSAEYISAYLADTDKFFEVVEPVRKAVGKAYDKLDLQTEFESLVSAKEAYYENAEFKNNAEDQRLEKGQLYSFEINTNNIDPDDSTDMKQLRAEHKPQVVEQDTQKDDSHRSDNKQRNKNRP